MTLVLENQVAVVFGGAGIIGAEMCKALGLPAQLLPFWTCCRNQRKKSRMKLLPMEVKRRLFQCKSR